MPGAFDIAPLSGRGEPKSDSTPLLGSGVAVLAISASVVRTAGGIFNVVPAAIILIGFGYYGFVKPESAASAA